MAVTCNICDKSYHSEKKLLKHQQNKHIIYKKNKTPKRVSFSDHVIVHEVKEYHKCRKCPKFFEDYKSLKQHMRKWHKKRKCYICNYCNKKFVDRMFFKVHICLHCDICGCLFSKRSKFLEHRRDKCRVFKLHKCKTCEESYFNVMHLKDHSYDHDEDLNYVCDICKEKFKTKCAIAHHFAFLHSDKKRPSELYVMLKMGTERLYLCEFCDESSVERDVIEAHMQKLPDLTNKATTGYKDYYFCDQCMQQFDTETDMLQHKWTHFLKTSNNSQTRPKGILKQPPKRFFNINEQIPPMFKPVIILERVDEIRPTQFVEFAHEIPVENVIDPMKKALVDPKSKKTKRDDLEQLKNAFKRAQEPSPATSSDSEGEGGSEMAVTCNICDKSYHSEKKLLKHQQNKHIIYKKNKTPKRVSFSDHVIVHEVKEYHKCRKCPKFFEDYKSLKQHMRKWHKKRKCYICNYCNKKFVDRMFFKVHICLHCDICGCLFSKRSKFLEHRRDKCRVFKLHKCKTCEESYFNVMHLKDHSYDHDEDLNYVCDICKEKFKTKCAIAHHFAFLHSDKKRPSELYVMLKMGTERLYLCEFCDESSVERDVIEAHMQKLPDLTNKATTGYKDYYFCDQCMQQFDTETDMLQHKWTHFLKTSNNSQTRPKGILKQPPKRFFNINEQIPPMFKPVIILERVDEIRPTQFVEFAHEIPVENVIDPMKKALVDPKSKKTLLSKHRCETCGRYFSTSYCLNRHIATQHDDFDKLRCKVCEETFVWPSLLISHKCIRLNHPEMPFDDARAEILFDNLNSNSNCSYTSMSNMMTVQNGFDDLNNLNIEENDDYMNRVDFDIPAPIVELRECDSTFMRLRRIWCKMSTFCRTKMVLPLVVIS